MRKIISFIIFATVCMSISAQKSGKNITLKTEKDSISYAYGVGLAQQGLQQYMAQLGIIADTAVVRVSYDANIATETDPAKKKKLEKELQFKLDSINKANNKNMGLFIEGITSRFKAKEDNSAYFEGISIGSQLTKMLPSFSTQLYGENKENEINKELVLTGLFSALKNEKIALEDAYTIVEQKMTAAQARLAQEKEAELKIQSSEAITKAEKFFKENGARPEVITLPTGLQYQILTEGTGAKPTADNKVKVHYRGTLLDGTEFDSSIARGEPAVFGVGQVIKGWTEALQLMPVGSKWMLFIPYDLAYGAQGAGNMIPPFSALIFEVELLGIE